MSEAAVITGNRPDSAPPGDSRERESWGGIALTRTGPYRCIVSDLAADSVSIRIPERLDPTTAGEKVTLIISAIGMFRGEVAWVRGTTAGVRVTATS